MALSTLKFMESLRCDNASALTSREAAGVAHRIWATMADSLWGGRSVGNDSCRAPGKVCVGTFGSSLFLESCVRTFSWGHFCALDKAVSAASHSPRASCGALSTLKSSPPKLMESLCRHVWHVHAYLCSSLGHCFSLPPTGQGGSLCRLQSTGILGALVDSKLVTVWLRGQCMRLSALPLA